MEKFLFFVFGRLDRYIATWIGFVCLVSAICGLFHIPVGPITTIIIIAPFALGSWLGPIYTRYTNDFAEIEKSFVDWESRMPQAPEEVAKEVTQLLTGKRGGYAWDRFYTDSKYYEKFGARWKTLLTHIANKGSELSAKTLTNFLKALRNKRDGFSTENSYGPMVDVLRNACDVACNSAVKQFDYYAHKFPGNQMTLEIYLQYVIRYDWVVDVGAVLRLALLIKETKGPDLMTTFLTFFELDPEFRLEVEEALKEHNKNLKGTSAA